MERSLHTDRVVKMLAILGGFLGFVPVSNLFGDIRKTKFSFCSIFTLISLSQLASPILYNFCTLAGLLSASEELKRTEAFILVMLIPADCFSCTVTRISTSINCGNAIKLMLDAVEMKRQMTCAGFQRRRSKWSKRFFLLVCAAWVLAIFAHTMFIIMTGPEMDKGSEYNAWLYPLTVIAMLSMETAQAYALVFTLTCGVYLLDLQDALGQLLCAELQGTVEQVPVLAVATRAASNNGRSVENDENQTKPRFFEQFKTLKSLFSAYDSIAGWYVLALLVVMVAGLTQAVCYVVFRRSSLSENVGVLLESASAILLLAFFGEFVQNEVSCPFCVSPKAQPMHVFF